MNKRILLPVIASSLASICIAIVSLQRYEMMSNADSESYSMRMNVDKNKLHNGAGFSDGSIALKTELGNEIPFTYSQIKSNDYTWQILGSTGYFYNTKAIHGLKNITFSFNTENVNFRIYYSTDASLDSSQSFISITSTSFTFDFDSSYPNYFKIENSDESELDISSIVLEYTCLSNYYSFNLNNSDVTKGSISGDSGKYIAGANITISAIPYEGYELVGWYEGDNLLYNKTTYTFTMPSRDFNVEARWKPTSYYIFYNLDGGVLPEGESNPASYTIEDHVTFTSPTKQYYTFTGWRSGEEIIHEIPKGTTGVMYLIACWSINSYQVNVSAIEEGYGEVTGSGSYQYGSEVTISATANEGYIFKGWYDSNEELLTLENTYTFTMPGYTVNYNALFIAEEDEDKRLKWEIDHGIIPYLDTETNTITYGLYPQTHVNDSDLITKLNLSAIEQPTGYYLLEGENEYEDEYYAKITANPYGSNYTFSTGTKITKNTAYWFKCEPIRWKIVYSYVNEYFLLTDLLIDTMYYRATTEIKEIDGQDVYPNNYYYSDIRAWLNCYDVTNYGSENFSTTGFSYKAFYLDSDNLLVTEVDNSAKTTVSVPNQYASANTYDKVFMPSYQDYQNSNYSISSNNARMGYPTDYALARNLYKSNSRGKYWTRSPIKHNGRIYLLEGIDVDGVVGLYIHNDSSYIGVRAAITIDISK